MSRLLSLCLALVAAHAAACVPPNCDRPDFGTCVNACCKLQFQVGHIGAKALIDSFAARIKTGGPDQRYFAVENNTVQPWSAADNFVVQAIHTTFKRTYNDTLHFAATPPPGQGHQATTLHAFSHSQDFIHGNFAYGDHGQNYKNLVTLVDDVMGGLGLEYTQQTVFGCAESA